MPSSKYHKHHSKRIFSDFSEETVLTQEDLNKKPSKNDLKDVKHILSDFYINARIPNFDTVSELKIWLRNTIMSSLRNREG